MRALPILITALLLSACAGGANLPPRGTSVAPGNEAATECPRADEKPCL